MWKAFIESGNIVVSDPQNTSHLDRLMKKPKEGPMFSIMVRVWSSDDLDQLKPHYQGTMPDIIS